MQIWPEDKQIALCIFGLEISNFVVFEAPFFYRPWCLSGKMSVCWPLFGIKGVIALTPRC